MRPEELAKEIVANMQKNAGKPGLWANIHAKRKRGEKPVSPGDKDYPDAKNWKKVTEESEKQAAPAWQTSEGKSESGGLNDKGRASLKAQGHDIKRPQPEGGPRKDSFCARMKGMKAKLTSEETARDPDSRINKSLRKWKCGSAVEKLAFLLPGGFNFGGLPQRGPETWKSRLAGYGAQRKGQQYGNQIGSMAGQAAGTLGKPFGINQNQADQFGKTVGSYAAPALGQIGNLIGSNAQRFNIKLPGMPDFLMKQSRCWEGYEAVPGKKPYSEDSCRPVGSSSSKGKKTKSVEKKANALTNLLAKIKPHLPTKRQALLGAGAGTAIGGGAYMAGKGIYGIADILNRKAQEIGSNGLKPLASYLGDTAQAITDGVGNKMKEIGDQGAAGWSMDPALANAIVGGGGGALLGAGYGALTHGQEADKRKEDRKSMLSRMLSYGGLGALGGAGLGAGATEGVRYLAFRPGTSKDPVTDKMVKDIISGLNRKQQFGIMHDAGSPYTNNSLTNFVQGLGNSAGLSY